MAILFALAFTFVPAIAHAYHVGAFFDRDPGAGGAGGRYYTGAKRDRGWDCTACHVDPPGRLRVDVRSEPSELLAEDTYTPGATYTITIAMTDPSSQLGLAATRSNFNGIVWSALDDTNAPAGSIAGFDPTAFTVRSNSILTSESVMVNETSWTFSWTAPAAGTIALDLGVVDGDGARQTGAGTLTDPLGDDVVMVHHVVTPRAMSRSVIRPAHGNRSGAEGTRDPRVSRAVSRQRRRVDGSAKAARASVPHARDR